MGRFPRAWAPERQKRVTGSGARARFLISLQSFLVYGVMLHRSMLRLR
jgi:hypothetical protein